MVRAGAGFYTDQPLWAGQRKVYFKDVNNQNPSVELSGGTGIFKGIRRFNDGSLYFKRNGINNDDIVRIDQADTQSPTISVQQIIGAVNIPQSHSYYFNGIWATQPHRLYKPDGFVYRNIGEKHYELTDHTSTALSTGLGNVRATITDRKVASMVNVGTQNFGITGYTADISSAQDYYPGGSIMPGRSFDSPDYTYGFNGMEKDDEIKGSGNSYDFGARIYDPRIVRWLSLDPAAAEYPSLSDYSFVANSPIQYIDPDGKRIRPVNERAMNAMASLIGSFGSDKQVYEVFQMAYDEAKGEYFSYDQSVGPVTPSVFKDRLKSNGIKMNKSERAKAYAVYLAVADAKQIQVEVVESSESEMVTGDGGREGSRVVPGDETMNANPGLNEFKRDLKESPGNPEIINEAVRPDDGKGKYNPDRVGEDFAIYGSGESQEKVETILIDGSGKSDGQNSETLQRSLNTDE